MGRGSRLQSNCTDHVERVLPLLLGRLEQTGQHGLGVCAGLGSVAAPVLARTHQRADGALGYRMPRAGLCRVVEFAPIDFEFHLGADAA